MAAYVYPDRGDRLTMALINEEYDGESWGKSEERVMALAAEALAALPSAPAERAALDVGCGLGRLFGFFAQYAGRIEALEPDRERCVLACQEARRVAEDTGVCISVINDILGDNKADGAYDFVVSSHVLQHLGRRQAWMLMQTMARKLKEGGLLILTTTYACDGQERFFCESWHEGRRLSRQVSAEEFETTFSEGGGLPVRAFTSDAIEEMADAAGLELKEFRPFHGKASGVGEGAREDVGSGAEEQGEREPRDAFYIFTKKDEQR